MDNQLIKDLSERTSKIVDYLRTVKKWLKIKTLMTVKNKIQIPVIIY